MTCPWCDGVAGWSYPTDYGTGIEYDSCSVCRGTGRLGWWRGVIEHVRVRLA